LPKGGDALLLRKLYPQTWQKKTAAYHRVYDFELSEVDCVDTGISSGGNARVE